MVFVCVSLCWCMCIHVRVFCICVCAVFSCRQWWTFAIHANLSEIGELRRRRNWDFALQRARDAQVYTNLYFQRLKGAPLDPHEEVLKITQIYISQTFLNYTHKHYNSYNQHRLNIEIFGPFPFYPV